MFAGVSLEGAGIVEGDKTNADYYGQPVKAQELLAGEVAPPAGAESLYGVLDGLR